MLDKLISWIWIKHPRSEEPDAMLTFAAIALFVCAVKFLLNGAVLTVGVHTVNFGTTDSLSYAALLGPTVLAYVQRKIQSPPDGK